MNTRKLVFVLLLFIVSLKQISAGYYQQIASPTVGGQFHSDVQFSGNQMFYGVNTQEGDQQVIKIYKKNLANSYDYLQTIDPPGSFGFVDVRSDRSFQLSHDGTLITLLDYIQGMIYLYKMEPSGFFPNNPTSQISTGTDLPYNGDLSEDLLCVTFYSSSTNPKLYNIASGSIIYLQDLTTPTNILSIYAIPCAISKDQKQIAVGYASSNSPGISMYSYSGGSYVYSYTRTTLHTNQYSLRFSASAKSLVLGTQEGVQVFERACLTDQFGPGTSIDTSCGSYSVGISSTGQYIYTSCYTAPVHMNVYQRTAPNTYSSIFTQNFNGFIYDISLPSSGRYWIVALNSQAVDPPLYQINCPDPTFNLCLPCQSPCLTCLVDRITCLTLESTYTSAVQLSDSTCNGCTSPCLRCRLDLVSNSQICTECMSSYSLSLGVCTSATLQCTAPCLTCSSTSTHCQTCVSGYYLSNSSTGTCSQCDSSCLTCNGQPNTCTSCADGNFLLNNACVACSSNCATCSIMPCRCLSCPIGRTLYGVRCLTPAQELLIQ